MTEPPTRADPRFDRPFVRAAFGILMLHAMAAATFSSVAIGLLATFLIDELAVTRTQIGVLIAVISVVGAIASPPVGVLTDRLGGRHALLGLYGLSALSFVGLAASPTFWPMIVAALAAAVAQAAGNPATNKLIAGFVAAGKRSLVTGVKQSGVQAGIFLGGLLVPGAALALGWRPSLMIVALIVAGGVPLTLWIVPATAAGTETRRTRVRSAHPGSVWWLMVYGFLLGLGGSISFSVPLYVEEGLGSTPVMGGIVAGATGLVAVAGRIIWARISELTGDYRLQLLRIAVLSILSSLAFLAAARFGLWLAFVGAVLAGASVSSWNSVGMLAVMDDAGPEGAGRSSGVVMFGFLSGLGLGPPVFGAIVDQTGAYTGAWGVSIAAFVLGAAVAVAWRRRPGPPAVFSRMRRSDRAVR